MINIELEKLPFGRIDDNNITSSEVLSFPELCEILVNTIDETVIQRLNIIRLSVGSITIDPNGPFDQRIVPTLKQSIQQVTQEIRAIQKILRNPDSSIPIDNKYRPYRIVRLEAIDTQPR